MTITARHLPLTSKPPRNTSTNHRWYSTRRPPASTWQTFHLPRGQDLRDQCLREAGIDLPDKKNCGVGQGVMYPSWFIYQWRPAGFLPSISQPCPCYDSQSANICWHKPELNSVIVQADDLDRMVRQNMCALDIGIYTVRLFAFPAEDPACMWEWMCRGVVLVLKWCQCTA